MAWDDCFTVRDYDRYMGYDNPEFADDEEPQPGMAMDEPQASSFTDEEAPF